MTTGEQRNGLIVSGVSFIILITWPAQSIIHKHIILYNRHRLKTDTAHSVIKHAAAAPIRRVVVARER